MRIYRSWGRRGLYLLAAFLLAGQPGGARSQDSKELTGAWKIKFEDNGKETQKILFVVQSDGKLKIKEKADDKAVEGAANDDGTVKFTLTLTDAEGRKRELAFSGSLKEKKLSGTVKIEGKEAKWTGTAVQTVYFCGNHKNPTHAADSKEMMDQLHDLYGCADWHDLSGDRAAAEIHRTGDR
jgi:hypothetical protein